MLAWFLPRRRPQSVGDAGAPASLGARDPTAQNVLPVGGLCGLSGGDGLEHWQVLLDMFLSVIWQTTEPDVGFCAKAVPAPALLLAAVSHSM